MKMERSVPLKPSQKVRNFRTERVCHDLQGLYCDVAFTSLDFSYVSAI